MKTLSDNTVLPESDADIEEIARKESTENCNSYYDFCSRPIEVKQHNIYHGKLAECNIAYKFCQNHYKIISGISFLNPTPDNGTDLTIEDKQTKLPVNIQVKSARDEFFNIPRASMLRTLKAYDGKILIYRESDGKVYELTKDILKWRVYASKSKAGTFYVHIRDLKEFTF